MIEDNYSNVFHASLILIFTCSAIELIHKVNSCINAIKLGTPFQNNKKRSHTQLDSRKQVIAFQDSDHYKHKGSSTPTKTRKTSNRQIQYNVENFDKIHASSASVRNWSSQ